MTIETDAGAEALRCAECGHPGTDITTIPALDGYARRCGDGDACEERKESRAAFTVAA